MVVIGLGGSTFLVVGGKYAAGGDSGTAFLTATAGVGLKKAVVENLIGSQNNLFPYLGAGFLVVAGFGGSTFLVVGGKYVGGGVSGTILFTATAGVGLNEFETFC